MLCIASVVSPIVLTWVLVAFGRTGSIGMMGGVGGILIGTFEGGTCVGTGIVVDAGRGVVVDAVSGEDVAIATRSSEGFMGSWYPKNVAMGSSTKSTAMVIALQKDENIISNILELSVV